MGIFVAFADSLSGTFADQWEEIITCGNFDEKTLMAPGLLKRKNNWRGVNVKGSEGIITNGSVVYVPEDMAIVVLDKLKIENIITKPGGYIYQDGEETIFDGDGLFHQIGKQIAERIKFGGISSKEKKILYVNLKEIKGMCFGTKGPMIFNDKQYGINLEIISHGTFSIRIVDIEKFVKKFVQTNTMYYSFDDVEQMNQVVSELINAYVSTLNSMAEKYNISEMMSKINEIQNGIIENKNYIKGWQEKFGFKLVNIVVENIELTQQSKKNISDYNDKILTVKAYKDLSEKESKNIAKLQISEGIRKNGLGSGIPSIAMGMKIGNKIAEDIDDGNSKNEFNNIDALEKISLLFEKGYLTKEEFELQKQKIINGQLSK